MKTRIEDIKYFGTSYIRWLLNEFYKKSDKDIIKNDKDVIDALKKEFNKRIGEIDPSR